MPEVQGPKSAEYRCRDCKRFDPERSYCRKDQRIVHPLSSYTCFEMELADHYVESPWSRWKRAAEKKAAAEKSKSSQ